MKKKIIFLIILLLIIFPISTKALNDQTIYVGINTPKNLTVNNLDFSNILFNNYSNEEFGLKGEVKNNSNDSITYTATVYYYDKDFNLITKDSNKKEVSAGTGNFEFISNSSIMTNHSTNEICYYQLFIDTDNDLYYTTPSKNHNYSSYDYVIDKYDVNIKVNENNTFDIIETITAYFNKPKHGILRKIPLSNRVVRLDGTVSRNTAKVSNVSIDNEYVDSSDGSYYTIKIGSADKTLTGEQTYVIKYTYDIGNDPVDDYDELYYNIIGNEWDTAIGNITFTIAMPKEFDTNKLGFSKGSFGSTNNSNIEYTVNDKVITGKYDGILESNMALTVRCELQEGYFLKSKITDVSNKVKYIEYFIFIGLPVIFFLIILLLWYKYGKDDVAVETVEFYPPEGYNSLEVGFLYNGKATSEDVTSLLIYLANKNYIKISEIIDNDSLFKRKTFKITKLKEYDGNNINEYMFLDGLFKCHEINFYHVDNENEVTKDDLYDKFYVTINKILKNINSNRPKIFIKSSLNIRILTYIMTIISYSIFTLKVIINGVGDGYYVFAMMALIFLFDLAKNIVTTKNNTHIALLIISDILILASTFNLLVLPGLSKDLFAIIYYIAGIIITFIMCILCESMPKRNTYGKEMYGKLKGFKNFLETVEKDKLEALVEKNPTYFYDILPYTYVLDVSNKWIKKFESISVESPTWYDGIGSFSMTTFSTFVDSTMSSMNSASDYSSSSDSSSGGGSSGGGSGGGGGSSW